MAGPLTPASGDAPYCTPAEFLAFRDANQVGGLVSDAGVQVTYAGLLAHPTLLAHLAAASGDLEMACVQGARYSPADLAALTGNGRAALAKLVGALACGSLLARRNVPAAQVPAEVLAARETLEKLANGELVLPFLQVEQAGNPRNRFRSALELLNAGLPADSYQGVRFMGPPSGGAYTPQNGYYGGGRGPTGGCF